MKKMLLSVLAIALTFTAVPQFVSAGGIENKQNFSARYIATGSRNAAIDGADIAAYNPAGVMMKEDTGLTLEADVQYILKDYEQDIDNSVFNAGLEASAIGPATSGIVGSRSGDQDEPSVVPTLFGTYKSEGKWGAFGSFTVNAGGGEVDYPDGNIVTNMVEAAIHSGSIPGYGVDEAVLGEYNLVGSTASNEEIFADTYYLTFTAGPTYAFTDNLSMGVGLRYVMAEKSIEAYADMSPGTMTANTSANTVVAEYEQEGDGIGYVISFDYQATEETNFALRYESEVEIELDTDFANGNTALGNAVLAALDKTDGMKEDRNLAALLGLGISHKASDKLTLDTSFTYYFEEQANWDGHEDDVSNSFDFGISGTYEYSDNLRFSLGYLHTNVGIDADDYDLVNMMNPPLDAHTLALGFGYDINDKMTLEFGAMRNMYVSDTGTDPDTGIVTKYDKLNHDITLGFIYKL